MIDFEGAGFGAEVIRESYGKLVVAYFTTPWCGPCRMLKPRLEELESESMGLTVVRIDATIFPALAEQYEIKTVPTLLLYSEGLQVDRIEGIQPKNVLAEKFKKWL